MKLAVPTVMCRASVRVETRFRGLNWKPGAIVSMPYGIALFKIEQGIVGAIVDAEAKRIEAIEALKNYGADAWFPAEMQTFAQLAKQYGQQAGSSTGTNADAPRIAST